MAIPQGNFVSVLSSVTRLSWCNTADLDDLDAASKKAMAAFKAGDFDTFSKSYCKDCVMIPAGCKPLIGRTGKKCEVA